MIVAFIRCVGFSAERPSCGWTRLLAAGEEFSAEQEHCGGCRMGRVVYEERWVSLPEAVMVVA